MTRTASGVDTVENAAATPEQPQPYGELGLAADEYARIREILGRRPTSSELAIYSVMWSEHCSYKSSRIHLRQFGEKAPKNDALLAGMGENAGVVDAGDGWAVTFKIESYNHPSYIEPYQGAATGVGGIVRDILAMGARPVAVMDPLRFGPLDATDTARVLPGIVAGVGGNAGIRIRGRAPVAEHERRRTVTGGLEPGGEHRGDRGGVGAEVDADRVAREVPRWRRNERGAALGRQWEAPALQPLLLGWHCAQTSGAQMRVSARTLRVPGPA